MLELQLAGCSGEQIREQPSSRKSVTSVPLKPSTAVLRPVERQIWTLGVASWTKPAQATHL